MSYEVISYAKKNLDKELKDSAFIAVADYLYSAIKRDRKGVQVKNFLL